MFISYEKFSVGSKQYHFFLVTFQILTMKLYLIIIMTLMCLAQLTIAAPMANDDPIGTRREGGAGRKGGWGL
jgi:hypothetical protein